MTERSAAAVLPTSSAPLPYTQHSMGAVDIAAVVEALRSPCIARGPRASLFETSLAREAGTRHAVAVSSGTAALHVALASLGVGPGDEVLVPALTFVATANAVALCGAKPCFVDVDPKTLNLSPRCAERALGPKTVGAIAVHYGGHPADTDGLAQVLGPDRFLLEDASHALGAKISGRPAGSLGTAACFSFHPAKSITTGEGGAVTTASDSIAALASRLRDHGIARAPSEFRGLGLPSELAAEASGPWVYEQHDLGLNYRLSDIGAALGLSQLARLQGYIERRREIAATYRDALCDLDALDLPEEGPDVESAWHLYAIQLRREAIRGGRAALYAGLHAAGIQAQVHFIPVHLQPYYRDRYGTAWGDLPVTEAAYLRLLSLPLFPGMSDADVQRVVATVRDELGRLRR